MRLRLLLLLAAILLLAACHRSDTPQPNIPPTATAVVASEAQTTPPPIATPRPSNTPAPTATPTASATATRPPTDTPTPSVTPTPPPTITPCPPDVLCPPTPVPTPAALAATDNILFLGTDLRESADLSWRTDTILLAAIDWQQNRVGILSFPRDLWVEVPRFGHKRLNQVDFLGEYYEYPGGGFALLKETFANNFGIHIDHFARLHRSGFVDIIDALGGVDVTLDCDLWELTTTQTESGETHYEILYIPAGPQHFDGEQALRFATFRYVTGDYDRARRQQVVLLALRNQLVQAGVIKRIPQLWQALHDYFQTDLNILDIIKLGRLAANIQLQEVHAHVIGKYETEPLVLESGAEVLVSEDDRVHEAIRHLFDAEPIQDLAERPSGCPPTPTWAQTPTPTSTATPAP